MQTRRRFYLLLMLTVIFGISLFTLQPEPVYAQAAGNNDDAAVETVRPERVYVQVVAGEEHACGLTDAGEVFCWGSNGNDQLGDRSGVDSPLPVAVLGLDGNAVELAAAGYRTCAILEDGSAQCWPLNWDELEPTVLPGLEQNVTMLDGGQWHFCAVVGEEVLCWGNNGSGQLGDGTDTEREDPAPVAGLSGAPVAVTAGVDHTCALLDTGAVQCWGSNSDSQLGNGATEDSLTPVDVIGLNGPAVRIAAGDNHTCVLLDNNEVQCWGFNAGHKPGSSEWTLPEPITITGLGNNITDLAAGSGTTCVLGEGVATCWSNSNVSGQLGATDDPWEQGPLTVQGFADAVVDIGIGTDFSCAVIGGGKIQCWGYNQRGQLGIGEPTQRDIPVMVRGIVSPTSIALGGWYISGFTCAAVDGRLKCWGDNGGGFSFGVDTVDQSGVPADGAEFPAAVSQVTAGVQFACALMTTGRVQCWGPGFNGQLGKGDTGASLTPVQVSGLTQGVKQLVGGAGHTCALTEDGKVLCWGSNDDGQLGIGDEPNAMTPTSPIGLETGVSAIYTSDGGTCALLEDGTTKCWGSNYNGQLGDGTKERRNEPTQVIVLEDVAVDLALGGSHTCALLEDGTARCWGANWFGQLGDGTDQDVLTQTVAVQGLPAPIVDLEAASNRTCAILDDGSLWCWGDNSRGDLGAGTAAISSTVPLPVLGLGADVTAAYLGPMHSCAVLATGEVRCWGEDGDGQLGIGTTSTIRTPMTVVEKTVPEVRIDAQRGAAGSRFTLTGEQFTPATPLTAFVNGEPLSPTLITSGRGGLLAWLDAADADPGYYEVDLVAGDTITATDIVSLTLHLLITDTAPLLEPIGGAVPTLVLPAGIARDPADAPAELQQRTYLTINAGVNVRSAPNGDLVATTGAVTDVLYDAGRTLDEAVEEATFIAADGTEVVLQGVSVVNRVWLPVLWENEPAWVADVVVSGVAVR